MIRMVFTTEACAIMYRVKKLHCFESMLLPLIEYYVQRTAELETVDKNCCIKCIFLILVGMHCTEDHRQYE